MGGGHWSPTVRSPARARTSGPFADEAHETSVEEECTSVLEYELVLASMYFYAYIMHTLASY